MNVYQEDQYPFLKKEDLFIKKVVAGNIPFLGICLGSQLLAKACGARVTKSPAGEIGFFDVSLTKHGQRDGIFKNIGPSLKVFQWHEDMFGIPEGALWLAKSASCPHQACRVVQKAYGFQFHIEVDRAMIIAWMKEYWKVDNVLDREKARNILSQYDQAQPQLCQVAEQVYNNFAAIINKAS
jgi:GMP synthase-like glutamine amidotransferase